MHTLLAEIEAFLKATAMPPTRFGRAVLRDPGFVGALRAGRRVWPETAAKVRAFIAGFGDKP